MDYEKAYTPALLRAKQAIKDCGHNEGLKRMIEGIFPELTDPDRIRQELIQFLQNVPSLPSGKYSIADFLLWLERQGEQKPDWSEYDKVVIDAIYNTLKHSNVTKCGVEVTEMLLWLEELEKQGEQNNLVEQLTAFAQHLNKRGAFRDDLCMDFEHEAQSFIEMQKFNATQLGV